MNFTLTVPKNWNYTPSDLIRKYAKDNPRYTFTYDHFFTSVLHDNKTDINYYYDHFTREINNVNHTETVTVFLEMRRNANELPDFTSPEAFFCEPD